jgi:hypothetical protein
MGYEASPIAQRKLGELVGGEDKYRSDRFLAGKNLVSDFVTLAKHYGLVPMASDNGNSCSVVLRNKTVAVEATSKDGEVYVVLTDDQPHVRQVVPLRFEPLTKTLHGKDLETEIVPKPGEPVLLKGAMTALIETVAKLVGADLARHK